MAQNNTKNTALKIFLSIFAIVAVGVGGYFWWDYEHIKKINATVVSIDEAKALAQKVLY